MLRRACEARRPRTFALDHLHARLCRERGQVGQAQRLWRQRRRHASAFRIDICAYPARLPCGGRVCDGGVIINVHTQKRERRSVSRAPSPGACVGGCTCGPADKAGGAFTRQGSLSPPPFSCTVSCTAVPVQVRSPSLTKFFRASRDIAWYRPYRAISPHIVPYRAGQCWTISAHFLLPANRII